MKRSRIFLALALTMTAISTSALACGEITPNKEITKTVTRLAYSDFPRASDVFAIMRNESSMNPHARNHTVRESSNGLMQVQNGSFNIHTNIAQGIAKLREYYKLTHSVRGAVESYNIGPRNYLNHHMILSGEAYYDKFLLQKRVYARWPHGKIVKLGKKLGCGRDNGIPYWLQKRLAKK